MNYLQFYDLTQEPFSNAPVSRFYYSSAQHAQALMRLTHAVSSPQKLRIRGHAPEACFQQGQPVRVAAFANGQRMGDWTLGRTGLFVLEADLAPASEYMIEIQASPTWQSPPDDRVLTVNLSLVRLVAPSGEK